MFHQMGTAELRQSDAGGGKMAPERRWHEQVPTSSRPPLPPLPHLRPSRHHVAFTLHFPAAVLARGKNKKRAARTVQWKTLLIAFSCRCFMRVSLPRQQAEEWLRDEANMLTGAVQPRQGKRVGLKRCWKCRQPCRDTQREPRTARV